MQRWPCGPERSRNCTCLSACLSAGTLTFPAAALSGSSKPTHHHPPTHPLLKPTRDHGPHGAHGQRAVGLPLLKQRLHALLWLGRAGRGGAAICAQVSVQPKGKKPAAEQQTGVQRPSPLLPQNKQSSCMRPAGHRHPQRSCSPGLGSAGRPPGPTESRWAAFRATAWSTRPVKK